MEDRIPDFEQRLLTSLEFSEADLRDGREGVSAAVHPATAAGCPVPCPSSSSATGRDCYASAPVPGCRWGPRLAYWQSSLTAFLSSELLSARVPGRLLPFAISEAVIVVQQAPDIELTVEPGDIEMQRGDSVTIVARVNNAMPANVNLRLQDDNVNWRDVTMSRDGNGSDSATYSYYIPALQEDTTYYISFDEGEGISSPQYEIRLFDLPQVERIDLSFTYPDYTGLEGRGRRR